jgi:hypothetical protein
MKTSRARTRSKRTVSKKTRRSPKARKPSRVTPRRNGILVAPVEGAERRHVGNVTLEVARAGAARVKRTVYPPGWRWSKHMKQIVGTDLCMHAHVGFLAGGEFRIEYADGCTLKFKAPQIVAIEPGHDGWVVGKEPAVLIQFDFEHETIKRLGMPDAHRHA